MKKERIGKIIFSIMMAVLIVFTVINLYNFICKGKQIIEVKTSANYYSQTAINATINVKDIKTDRIKDCKINVELYDHDDKKIKVDYRGFYNIYNTRKKVQTRDIKGCKRLIF